MQRRLAATFLVFCAILPSTAGAATFQVGSGPGCTHPDLAAAVAAARANGPGLDEIQLFAPQRFAGFLDLSGTALWLRGGGFACGSGVGLGRTRIEVTAGGGFSVAGQVAAFDDLDIVHLAPGATSDSLIRATGDFQLLVRRSSVAFGRAPRGGNVQLAGTETATAVFQDVILHNGEASGVRGDGGGLSCEGPLAVTWLGPMTIAGNRAERGGGAAIRGGCRLESFAADGPIRIEDNVARIGGGGLYVSDDSFGLGAVVQLRGSKEHPLTIQFNQAHYGGGVMVSNGARETLTPTRFRLEDGVLADNIAAASGGGLLVWGLAEAVIDRREAKSRVERNGALGAGRLPDVFTEWETGRGGAFFLDLEARLTVHRTEIRRNFAVNSASVAQVQSHSRLFLESSTLFGNFDSGVGAHLLTAGFNPAVIEAAFVSSAANLSTASSRLFAGTVLLFSSVLGESQPHVVALGAGSLADCLIVPDAAGLPPSGILAVPDPRGLFLDPAAGDLRPAPGALSLDFCDTYFFTPTTTDLGGRPRPFDLPTPNLFGPYDLGAYEADGSP